MARDTMVNCIGCFAVLSSKRMEEHLNVELCAACCLDAWVDMVYEEMLARQRRREKLDTTQWELEKKVWWEAKRNAK